MREPRIELQRKMCLKVHRHMEGEALKKNKFNTATPPLDISVIVETRFSSCSSSQPLIFAGRVTSSHTCTEPSQPHFQLQVQNSRPFSIPVHCTLTKSVPPHEY